ncbi:MULTISPECIES: polysaccharide deacetylase family protein [unclassified Streptomyces]|uniref:polysaccharide deacetylase family protein n=1 Tax=unclassified Streptomyces TaxID=2593676 RepID=UPI000DBA07E8|nr:MULTISPECIES: polysaccharide deacetylase family protein [Streptomyces]MYU03867.1 polysaccharide deacetylase family protein [Streptomyces sp. SID8366]MYU62607.1 polysaccharide deacetylase family protein [Streptomyces sp. SID69]RAJ49892.1 peptidoglycan/xylan/chitin deacetylase (PgdA/CDA1 family) [Streptomyces sp. PsTaAH-130]TXJ72170.1 polysaccharide deacetylase family protein [Streptomyces lavendulae]
MARVTTTNRRDALRAGAGLVAGGALAAGCGTGPKTTTATRTAPESAVKSSAKPSPTAPAAPGPRAYPGQPAQITHGPRTRPQLALTFHGQGDPALAQALLTTAERHGAHLTVLAVGSWLDEHPDLARRILDGGHDLGNHTQRHISVNDLPEADARKEITDCADRLRRLTGSIGTWFRPSRAPTASALVAALARRAGYPHVLSYDVDSLDYTSPGAAAVTRKVLSEVREGSVVSLHFGYEDTVAALPDVLTELDRRKLRAVTTTELLS